MKNIIEYLKESYWTSTYTHNADDFNDTVKPIKVTDNNVKKIVRNEIKRLGKDADLNHIDVSDVTEMAALFSETDFCGDVSKWDVSNVTNMQWMFAYCEKFNCDISGWNVSKVQRMDAMFYKCKSFNQDLSKWDVRNLYPGQNPSEFIFDRCPLADKKEFQPKFKTVKK